MIKELKYLNISNCIVITDITINTIANSCLSLKYLDLKGYYNISKEAIYQLISNIYVENFMGISLYYISIIDKYYSQYDVYELVKLKQKIRCYSLANNLN